MSENRFKKFSPDIDFSGTDHIIIGSGMGGLTAATWLAKAGKKVVVFERHYTPGGFTHRFKRKKGFSWDVGVHYVGNMAKGNPLRGLFDFITGNTLEWESMGDIYDVVHIGDQQYKFVAGKENFRNQLITYFPEESQAIDAYLRLLKRSNKWANAFFFEKTFKPFLSFLAGTIIKKQYDRYSGRTTLDVLNELTSNKRLIAVLCAQCGNYGLSPKHSSFGAHAIVVGHFMEGGYYPKGGSDQISLKTSKTIRDHGGEVYINAEVGEIVVEGNSVQGVKIGDKFIASKSVISNVGVKNTFHHLLSESALKKSKFTLQNVKPSTGHMCLYVGLDKSDAELSLPKHNVWSFNTENFDEVIDQITVENTASQFSYVSFPSAKDPQWADTHPNMATIQALSVGNYDWFSAYEKQPWRNREMAYEKLKKNFEESMLQRLYQLFPQIEGHVVVTEVSTPLSTRHFSNYKNGEIYGLAHTPERFSLSGLRPETKIKGLRLVGQDITIVGVAGAMLSGMLASITILKFGVWRLFREVSRIKNENRKTHIEAHIGE